MTTKFVSWKKTFPERKANIAAAGSQTTVSAMGKEMVPIRAIKEAQETFILGDGW